MDIEGMKYNTERDKLVISEYGRNIQIMIQHLLDIDDRQRRTEAAHFVINVMAQMNPQVKESNDYLHKLWDHLHIISGYKLDVDSPYDPPKPETQTMKPEPIEYHKNNIKFGHYGQHIYNMIQEVKKMEDSPKRQALLYNIANHMKRAYLSWNRDTVNDLLILDDLYKLSNEEFTLPIDTKLIPTSEILSKPQSQQPQQQQKKKKAKKQHAMKVNNPNRPNKK